MGQYTFNFSKRTAAILVGALAMSISGCASPGKTSIANVKQSSLMTSAAPNSNDYASSTIPTLKIRYPAIISEDIRGEYNQKLAYQRLGYTWSELEKQAKYEQSAKIEPTENLRGVSINEINLMAIARSGVTANMIYDRAKELIPGTIILEPLEIRRNPAGGFIGVPIDGVALPSARLELDLAIYSHPDNESFSGKAIPLVTVRSGLSDIPPYLIASDGLASAPGIGASEGYTLIDFLSATNSSQVCIRADGCIDYNHRMLNASAPITSLEPHVLRLEKIDFRKGALRKFLEGEEDSENPMLERFIDPLLWRVQQLLELSPANYDERAVLQEYSALVFQPDDAEFLQTTLGEDVFSEIVTFIYQQEIELLESDSEMIRQVTLESDYASSVNELIIQEVKFEQRQEMMNTLAFATAFVGAGASLSQAGTQAAQSIINSTNVMISSFMQANESARDNFTLVFSPLLNEERSARQYKIYGGEQEISATTIGEFRTQQAEIIVNNVRTAVEDAKPNSHLGDS